MKFLKRHLGRFATAIRFFTRIPLPDAGLVQDEEFGKSLAYAPLTGLLIGVWTAGWDFVFRLGLPPLPAAILTLFAYVAITGGLHLDGLGDTFDGILSGRSRDRMLEIMKDSRVGSFGLLSVWFVLSLDAACLSSLPDKERFAVLCLWPVLGRVGSVAGAALHDYARPEGGLGKSFVAYCGKRELLLGILTALAAGSLLLGWRGAVWAAASALVVLFLLNRMTKPLGGVTGDVLGAACESVQALSLPLWLLIVKWPG